MDKLQICVLLVSLCQLPYGSGRGLSPPQNVTIVSRNLNPILRWIAPAGVVGLSNGSESYDNYIVTYTVQYLIKDTTVLNRQSWVDMPGCTDISEHECKPRNIRPRRYNKYKVFAKAGNWTSLPSDIAPYSTRVHDKMLYPPPFEVTLNGSDAIINIKEPSKALWTNRSLVDVLDGVTYTVEYWNQFSSSNKSRKLSISEPATSTSFAIPLKRQWKFTICFSLKQTSEMHDVSNWSKPVCIKDGSTSSSTPSPKVSESIFAIAGLCVVLVLIVTVICIVTSVRCYRTINNRIKPDWDEIPKKLKLVFDENTNQYHPPDDSVEYPDKIDEKHDITRSEEDDDNDAVKEVDRQKDSEHLLCKEDTSDEKAVRSKIRHISETTETCSESETISAFDDVSHDVIVSVLSKPTLSVEVDTSSSMCDYVRVPSSPDSGLELPEYF